MEGDIPSMSHVEDVYRPIVARPDTASLEKKAAFYEVWHNVSLCLLLLSPAIGLIFWSWWSYTGIVFFALVTLIGFIFTKSVYEKDDITRAQHRYLTTGWKELELKDQLLQRARKVYLELPSQSQLAVAALLEELFEERIQIRQARAQTSLILQKWQYPDRKEDAPSAIQKLAMQDAKAQQREKENERAITELLDNSDKALALLAAGEANKNLQGILQERVNPAVALLNISASDATDSLEALAIAQQELDQIEPF